MKVFLASANAKKIREMERILAEHVPDIHVLGIGDVEGYVEPVEDEPTFAGNALLKARAGVAGAGQPYGAPQPGRGEGPRKGGAGGVYAPLDQLHDVPDERRGAHFTCAIAWVQPDGRERVVEGRMDGRIIRELRGSGGFGYDVLFVAQEHDAEGLTSAELEPEEKDRISHRGRALRELAPYVAADLAGSAD